MLANLALLTPLALFLEPSAAHGAGLAARGVGGLDAWSVRGGSPARCW